MDQGPFLVFHPGTQHSWQTAAAMQELGLLEEFVTSIFYQPSRWPYKLEQYAPSKLRSRLHAEFRRFSFPRLDPTKVRTVGFAEWAERVALRAGQRSLARRLDRLGNRSFARSLAAQIRSDKPFHLWGYDGAAGSAFELAKMHGRYCVLDRTIGDRRVYNRIMDELWREYQSFFHTADYKIPSWRIDADQREYELADAIVIGSKFAADTVRAESGEQIGAKLSVLNYCYDEDLFSHQIISSARAKNEPLRFLFLGQATVRKGIHLVLKAIERIPRSAASLTIVGDLTVPADTFSRYADRVTLKRTVARADVPSIMAEHDVYLLPSYFEGSAISILEAMASGLAIIQTSNAGCGVTDRSGILLNEPNEANLYDAMMRAVDSRDSVLSWKEGAKIDAKKYQFSRYRERIGAMISSL
jgi:glycosyltransferase involved in cell wall biosynthesis